MERERQAARALAVALKMKWEAEGGSLESKNPLDVQNIGKVFYGIGSRIADAISPNNLKINTAVNTSVVEGSSIVSNADSSPKQQMSIKQQNAVRPSVIVEELIPGRPRSLDESSSNL